LQRTDRAEHLRGGHCADVPDQSGEAVGAETLIAEIAHSPRTGPAWREANRQRRQPQQDNDAQGRDPLNASHIEEETMHKGAAGKKSEISTTLLLTLLLTNSTSPAGSEPANEIGSMGPVPKAQCGASDRTESGLQGQTTSKERASGDSERGYNCNLEVVGQ